MSRPSSATSQKFSRPAYLRLRDDALTIFAPNGGRDSNLRFAIWNFGRQGTTRRGLELPTVTRRKGDADSLIGTGLVFSGFVVQNFLKLLRRSRNASSLILSLRRRSWFTRGKGKERRSLSRRALLAGLLHAESTMDNQAMPILPNHKF
jgi:hypothetical protein